MAGHRYCILVVLGLPLQISCLGLKLEGLIDLGPKWDYKYNLTAINTDTNENEQLPNSRNIIRTDKKQDTSLKTDSVAETVESDDQGVDSSQDIVKGNVDSENRDIYDESSNERDREHTPHRYTKQFLGSRNTFIDDNDDKVEIDDKTKPDVVNLDKIKINIQTHGNISDSLLRIKSKKNERKIKDNAKIKEFTVHIYNQSLDIFDKMKKFTDDAKIKRKLKSLRMSYIEKFNDFVKENVEHKLKTNLANQNVILHTIDVNNYILKRIVNHLSEDKESTRISGVVNIFKNEIEKEKNIENKHACSKLLICRNNEEYTDFIINVLDIILLTDNRKMKQASDALTEVVKTNDLTGIIQNETQIKLRKLMTNIETWDPFLTRSMFLVLRNVLAYKNLPFIVMHANELEAINKTINLHNLIDILNKNMGTVENKNEWKIIITRMQEWSDGKRNDVQKTIEMIIRQIKKVFEKVDDETRSAVNNFLDELLARIRVTKQVVRRNYN